MNDIEIQKTILRVYQQCKVRSFPLDCFAVIKSHGIRIFTYQEFSAQHPDLYQIGMRYSKDAFQYRNRFCYNKDMPPGRIRFSLMHELGHYLLGHGDYRSPGLEQEANRFASHILAPRLLIWYAGCRSAAETAACFALSQECAAIAYTDYLAWKQHFLAAGLTDADKSLYRHFYHPDTRRVVWHLDYCHLCGMELYNRTTAYCPACLTAMHTSPQPEMNGDLHRAEDAWLGLV